MSKPLTFDTIVEHTKENVAVIGSKFDAPDDDWNPFVILYNSTAKTQTIVPMHFENDTEKDEAAMVLVEAVRYTKSDIAVFIMSGWEVKAAEGEDWTTIRAGTDMRREEVLIITVVSADRQQTNVANIKRDGVMPPTLTEWTKMDAASGRFVDPVLQQLVMQKNTAQKGGQN